MVVLTNIYKCERDKASMGRAVVLGHMCHHTTDTHTVVYSDLILLNLDYSTAENAPFLIFCLQTMPSIFYDTI